MKKVKKNKQLRSIQRHKLHFPFLFRYHHRLITKYHSRQERLGNICVSEFIVTLTKPFSYDTVYTVCPNKAQSGNDKKSIGVRMSNEHEHEK